MTKSKRFPEDIEKLDEFLFQVYGYGIYECCECVADQIRSIHPRYTCSLDKLSPDLRLRHRAQVIEAKKTIKRLEKPKNNLIDAVFDYYKLYWSLPKKAFDRNSDEYNDWVEFILDGLSLRQAFRYIDSVREGLSNDLKTSLRDEIWRTRGGQVKLVYKVACIFALVFRNNKGPDWDCILYQLQWFYKNLEGTDYQKELALPTEEPKELKKRIKNEYYKIMCNKKRSLDIETQRNKFFSPKTALYPDRGIKFEVPDHCRTLYLDTMKRLISRWEKDKKINRFRNQDRIEFGRSNIKVLPPNDCRPLVRFPDIFEGSSSKPGASIRDVLTLEEAAASLGMSSSDLLEKSGKGLIPHIPPNHRQVIILDFPNKRLTPFQEKCKKEQMELLELDGMITFSRRQLMEWKKAPMEEKAKRAIKKSLDKKSGHAGKPKFTIRLSEKDVLGLKEYLELGDAGRLEYTHKRERWLRENN